MHLFSGEAPPFVAEEPGAPRAGTSTASASVSADAERIAALEAAIADLRHELELLKARFDSGTAP
jgi:uncharacterized protein YceH (UPF0502 family)